MTKERKLAIEMWTQIRNSIVSSQQYMDVEDIRDYKRLFCKDHDLKWELSCWFCQYIRDCIKCPLGNCGFSSDYIHVVNSHLNKYVRIAACNNIIRALGGKA